MWRTRSDPSSSNGWWTRRSPPSCPTWPRNDGWRRRTVGTSRSSSSRSPTPAPRRCTASSTWPTPWTSNKPISGLAAQLKELGSEDSLNVRRAAAVGELARHQLALDLSDPGWLRRALRARLETTTAEAAGRPLRPPEPGRPRRRRHGEVGAGQPAGHRRSGPRLVRHRRQRHREAGPGPRGPRPRRHRRRTRPPRRDHRGPGPDLRLPLVHQVCETLRHRPHHPRLPRRPDVSMQSRAALSGDIIGSRPTAAGPTRPSNPASISGRRSTATRTCGTPTAPSTSAATAAAPPTDYPAPDPAKERGHRRARPRFG